MHSNSGDREQRPDCIVFSNASVKRGERLIWQHGDFSIPAGSVTAIVGTNGTGKTTMMKTELGLLPLAGGTVHVLGRPAGEMNRQIGYVPQSYTSDIDSNLTAEQSVLLGLTGTRFGVHFVTKAQRAKVKEAMTFTGIATRPTTDCPSFRAVCASASPSRRPWYATRNCSCSTSRSRISTWPASVPWCMCWHGSTRSSA